MSDIEMFSETESDQLLDVINIMNNEIEHVEEKVQYYKTKVNERFNNILKLNIENELLKNKTIL